MNDLATQIFSVFFFSSQKKHANSLHSNHHHSASDLSDDEQPLSVTPPPPPSVASKLVAEKVALLDALQKTQNLTELIAKKFLMNRAALGERDDAENRRPTMSLEGGLDCEEPSELIGNLLGISDSSILNKVLLSSADEAAKLLGVEK